GLLLPGLQRHPQLGPPRRRRPAEGEDGRHEEGRRPGRRRREIAISVAVGGARDACKPFLNGGVTMADEDSAPSGQTLAVRAAVGFAQGLALYGLYHWTRRYDPVAFGALTVMAWLVPIVFLGVFGVASVRTVVVWTAAAAVVTAIMGGYSAFVRQGNPPYFNGDGRLVIFFTAAALYILHHLIVPADVERRWRASYLRY